MEFFVDFLVVIYINQIYNHLEFLKNWLRIHSKLVFFYTCLTIMHNIFFLEKKLPYEKEIYKWASIKVITDQRKDYHHKLLYVHDAPSIGHNCGSFVFITCVQINFPLLLVT